MTEQMLLVDGDELRHFREVSATFGRDVELVATLVVHRTLPANETLVEVTRRIYTGELNPNPSNLGIALDLLKSKMHPPSP